MKERSRQKTGSTSVVLLALLLLTLSIAPTSKLKSRSMLRL